MIPAIRSELRKLATIRSTYVMVGLAAALVVFFAGYVTGWRAEGPIADQSLLENTVVGAMNITAIFVALIGILMMSHEYRYNTITYTMTLARGRSTILMAKILVLTGFTFSFVLIMEILAMFSMYAGAGLHGIPIIPQIVDQGGLFWRGMAYGWSFGMIGLLLAVFMRNQIAAIAALFLIPSTVEPLLKLLLKSNSDFLPFQAQQMIMTVVPTNRFSPLQASLIVGAYLVVGWAAAWVLFIRRDAS